MFKIEKNVPIPDNYRNKYNFAEMKIGDSVLLPHIVNVCQINSSLKRSGFKFCSRKTEGGLRVWRIA